MFGSFLTFCENKNIQYIKGENNLVSPKDSEVGVPEVTIQDTLFFKETFQIDDVENECLIERLKPIRENFKRINSKTEWTTVLKKDLWESTEGGEVRYYYSGDSLEKIVVRYFGEMGQNLIEYYLIKGEISFVFEKSYEYNRPFYWDSLKMKEFKDNQTFDFDKSNIYELRSYFEQGILIHQLNDKDTSLIHTDDYLMQEQKRITMEFNKLIEISNE